jgi:hypothetical protein
MFPVRIATVDDINKILQTPLVAKLTEVLLVLVPEI